MSVRLAFHRFQQIIQVFCSIHCFGLPSKISLRVQPVHRKITNFRVLIDCSCSELSLQNQAIKLADSFFNKHTVDIKYQLLMSTSYFMVYFTSSSELLFNNSLTVLFHYWSNSVVSFMEQISSLVHPQWVTNNDLVYY